MSENPAPLLCSIHGKEEEFLKLVDEASKNHRNTKKGGELRSQIEMIYLKAHKILIREPLHQKYEDYNVRLAKKEMDDLLSAPKFHLVRYSISRLSKSDLKSLDLVNTALDLYREAKYIHENIKDAKRGATTPTVRENVAILDSETKKVTWQLKTTSIKALETITQDIRSSFDNIFKNSDNKSEVDYNSYITNAFSELCETIANRVDKRAGGRKVKSFDEPIVKCDTEKLSISTNVYLTGGISVQVRAKAVLCKESIKSAKPTIESSINSITEDEDDLAMERARLLRAVW